MCNVKKKSLDEYLFKHSQSNAWLICLSTGLFFFYVFFQMNIFDVINQPLRQSFQINAEQLSWMSSTFVWASIIFFIPAGIIVDRFSIRKIILITMGICIIGTFGFALTHSFVLAAMFHALTGIANAFCFLSCMVLVYRFFSPSQQALVTGCLVTMAFLGGMAAHTPLAYLNDSLGWRQAILLDALFGVLIWGWLFFVIQDKPQVNPPKDDLLDWLRGFAQVLTNKQNWFAAIYTACLNLPVMVLCALWGSSYLKKVHGLSSLDASNIISLILMGSMFGGPLFGFFSDKLGRRKPVMLFGSAGAFVMMAWLVMLPSLSGIGLSVLFFLIGGFSSSQVIAYPLISESNHAHHTGLATALASMIITGTGGLGQVLFGMLLQHHAGVTATHLISLDFQYAITMLPIAALFSFLALLGVRETYCTRKQR